MNFIQNTKNLLIRFCALMVLMTPAVQAGWPNGGGGAGYDNVIATETSITGSTYVLGQFEGTAYFGDFELNSAGLKDIYLLKVKINGDIEWAIKAGGSSQDIPRDLAVDAADNVYVVGAFYGASDFGGDDVSAQSDVHNGFVAKASGAGVWQWVEKIGTNGHESEVSLVRSIEGDSTVIPPEEGSIYISGYFRNQAQIGSQNFTIGSGDNSSKLYMARIEHDGDWQWARYRSGQTSYGEKPTAMEVDQSGRMYVIGESTGEKDIYQQDFEGVGDYGFPPGWYSNWNNNSCPNSSARAHGVRQHNKPGNNSRDFFISGVPQYNNDTNWLNNTFIYSSYFNTTEIEDYTISVDIIEGQYPFSERPDNGENLELYLADQNGYNLYHLDTFYGGGGYTNGTFTYQIPAHIKPNGARLVFLKGVSTFACGDFWHFDNIKIEGIGSAENFAFEVSQTLTSNPVIGATTSLPADLSIADVAYNPASQMLAVSGTNLASGTGYCNKNLPAGAFVANLNTAVTPDFKCEWIKTSEFDSQSVGGGVTVATINNEHYIYQIGTFSGSRTFYNVDNQCLGNNIATETINSHDNTDDVFLVSYRDDGVACWVTGGNTFDDTDSYPAIIGDIEQEHGIDISTDGLSALYITGNFESSILFGEDMRFNGQGKTDMFVTSWGLDGRPFQIESWPVGVPLTPPTNAYVQSATLLPDFYQDGVQLNPADAQKLFYWSQPIQGQPEGRLIPLQPVSEIEIHWRVSSSPQDDNRVITIGSANWPTSPCDDVMVTNCYQVHVSGAPVEVEPASGDTLFFDLVYAGGAAEVNNRVFNNMTSGFSTLTYFNGPTPEPSLYSVSVEVVRTVPFTAAPLFKDNQAATIGTKITDTHHNEIGRSGYVVNELAFYDGVGTSAAYSRAARTGDIIPVNRVSSSRPQDVGRELVVAWYHNNYRGVFWPDKPVRYNPQWPFDPDKIIIASEQGGEVLGQAPLDPLQYPSVRLYIQDNPQLPGYNPNDEHALFAPSNTGSGHEAIFALRSDFGSQLNGDENAASDPYVLVKYYDEVGQAWRFRVFEVLATGAGFNQFNYTGTAATSVSPPYPVVTLPSCAESRAVGQAQGEQPPPPFFQDYKNKMWAKSAGSGSLLYYYPLQPGYFYDLDNNDIQDDIDNDGNPDLDGTCVPWLARLSEAKGGTANPTQPIEVGYNITWPADIPQLVIGETLLQPKNGLPAISSQASVEVVYDDIYSNLDNPLPTDTLAQTIDPLSPRFVRLAAIPSEIATEQQTNGLKSILGSADGVIKLPASIKKRLSFDPLNQRLTLIGLFDERGVGEPLLVPNVLSKNDRVALKKLNGGDGSEEATFTGDCGSVGDCSWDQAVEALFRYSRNPNRIEAICTSSIVQEGERICQANRPVNADDVLIGFQDSNQDYVLEPYRAVGLGNALTAGSAQGNGFMTIAFNNDPSLNPLPVSLNIIRVDCLRYPQPPAPPQLVKSYQGQLNVIAPENIFDEQIVLRHSGDFGGNPDALEFEWFFHPDDDGTPPQPLPNPDSGQLNGWIKFPVANPMGANEITIAGANIQTLSDNWYVARYRGLPACDNNTEWSLWAGQPGGSPLNERAQLAEGWVKRVLNRLNPFDARVQDFSQAATNNYASMLIQLGERYEGDIAMNNDPDNLNSIGLIEAYTTVMNRAMALSVDATPPVNYPPANKAILQVASKLVDFYTLLGNEAYADAQDPMIGITSENGAMTIASTLFTFQNQLDSLLSEELALLRGRDDSQGAVDAAPVYNRLLWNFTNGDGEVAYALSYNISDIDDSGVIDVYDAITQFPQGHGDAWGHYLTATDIYYNLLRHPFYTWENKTEAVSIAGSPFQVDYLDERQFAETAAAKARTGSEIVQLTYRNAYVEDPSGQYQGYTDSDSDRAWGVSGWARRAGTGAYFDWVTANAIIPDEDNDPDHQGIEVIERSNILDLNEIVASYSNIQAQIDKADRGLNPLGLATGMVPFDIDPDAVADGETHFEQVYERAIEAMDSLVDVWDFANQITNLLRQNQDSVEDISRDSRATENDFNNQLIEIFGLPYEDDIGPGGTYPAGYNGPDMYHYMYIDTPALAGTEFDFSCTQTASNGDCVGYDPDNNKVGVVKEFTGTFSPVAGGINFFNMGPAPINAPNPPSPACADNPLGKGCALGELNVTDSLSVKYRTVESADLGFAFAKPEEWDSSRRAVGQLQEIQQEMVMARVAVRQAMIDYDNLRQEIQSNIDTLEATYNITESTIDIKNQAASEITALKATSFTLQKIAAVGHFAAEIIDTSFENTAECIPRNMIAGLAAGGDVASGAVCAVNFGGDATAFAVDKVADGLEQVASATDYAAELVGNAAETEVMLNDAALDLFNVSGEIAILLRKEPALRAEIYARAEAARQLVGKFNTTLTRGYEVFKQYEAFRRRGAAAIQEYRYEDMAFRIFRNDALQKYRAAFDNAARYVYMAAKAYDYDTNLLGSDAQSGQNFLTDIIRERGIGQIVRREPLVGSKGLSDPMARMNLNFSVLKSQMGFNNPQVETNRFSLRYELFRVPKEETSDDTWRQVLADHRVDNLWDIPEFRRYARPFAPESAGPQPGIVLTFDSNVLFGLNFFGNKLGPGDSAYDASQFSTRVRGVGTWFEDYAGLSLSNTPRMYLFPVGADILRSPSANDFSMREWQIVDQKIPVPLPLGSGDLDTFDWLPIIDNQVGSAIDIRRYSQYRAHHYSEPFDPSEIISSSRLIGRSVWNRKWMMIIPGAGFLNDPNEGLDTFIEGNLIQGGGGERDGNGVSDIHLFFTTYSYSGN
ncbi:hypothetical protein GCM10011365_21160 [Marinicella pacifica]|uniref:Uncharacterized protein n=1 Tax=Marinicella pacifica TaxID=1171543 RepID=A0A917CWX3_9GAMM|nr:hypothetical protein [Marinicella pacifica]GGF99668.1 hypothetical protein GCM10011365_21160 [Marinicella pacifica]